MLQFDGGIIGLALNLDEDTIGAVILGEATGIEEGQSVCSTGEILSMPVGDAMLGRVVNAIWRGHRRERGDFRSSISPNGSPSTRYNRS